jgi:hypothetical protein
MSKILILNKSKWPKNKILIIPGHKGNANKNHLKIPTIKNTNSTNVGKIKKGWGEGSTHTLLVAMWISTTAMENSMEAPQKPKNKTAVWSRNTTPRNIPWKNVSQGIRKAPVHPCLL